MLADSLSNPDRILPTEWSIDRGIAYRFHTLGYSSSGTLCHQIKPPSAPVSPVPDHRACAVDAMPLDGEILFAYAFPPFKLVPLVLLSLLLAVIDL